MIALKHILVPTDFSETSQVAVNYGIALARAFNATLCLLHVTDESVGGEIVEATSLPLGLLDMMEHDARERLAHVLTEQEQMEIASEYLVRAGRPDAEIVRYAKEAAIDLIILGTHGRSRLAHILMGSVAEKVVRKAPCPVLTVRHPEHEFAMRDAATGQPTSAQL